MTIRSNSTCCVDCSCWFTAPESKLEIKRLNKKSLHVEQLAWTLFLIQMFLFVSTPILFRRFFRSISVSQLCSTGLWRPRCWHVLLWIAGNLNNATSGTVDLSISGTDMVEGRRRNTKKRRKKKQSGRRPVDGRKLGIFQQKRMQSVDLAGFVLADARKSGSQRVTNSSLMVTLPHLYISRTIWGSLLWVSVCVSVGGGVGGSGGRFFCPWNMTVVWRHDWPMSCTGEKILPHWLPFSWSWMLKQPLNTQERSFSHCKLSHLQFSAGEKNPRLYLGSKY